MQRNWYYNARTLLLTLVMVVCLGNGWPNETSAAEQHAGTLGTPNFVGTQEILDSQPTDDSEFPDLAYNPTRREFGLVYTDPDSYQVFFSRVNEDLEILSDRILTSGGSEHKPRIAFSKDALRFLVIYKVFGTEVRARIMDMLGTDVVSTFVVSHSGSGAINGISATVNENGDFFVAYSAYDDGAYDIWTVVLDADTGEVLSRTNVTDSPSALDVEPDIASSERTTGPQLVVWEHQPSGGEPAVIWGQRLSDQNELVGSVIEITTNVEEVWANDPRVAWGDNAAYMVAFERSGQIRATTLSQSGSIDDRDFLVFGNGEASRYPNLVANGPSSDEFSIVFYNEATGSERHQLVKAIVVDDNASIIGDTNATGSDSYRPASSPALAYDPHVGQSLVAWQDNRDTVSEIMGQMLSTSTPCPDADSDGYPNCDGSCDPQGNDCDCNDSDGSVYPNAPQICDNRNNDCNDPSYPTTPENEVDDDFDGLAECDGDCNDGDSSVYPGAPQACDGKNNDCDDPDYPDPPADEIDDDGDGRSECEGDCDDLPSSCGAACTPDNGSETSCTDGYDNDCDGNVDGSDPDCAAHRVIAIPDDLSVSPGASVEVPVHLSDGSDVTAIDLVIVHDTGVLTYQDARKTSYTDSMTLEANESPEGTLRIALFGSTALGAEGGDLIVITYTAVGVAGECSPIDLQSCDESLNEGSIPSDCDDGSVCIDDEFTVAGKCLYYRDTSGEPPAADKPVGNVTVRFYDPDTGEVFDEVYTDSNGHYEYATAYTPLCSHPYKDGDARKITAYDASLTAQYAVGKIDLTVLQQLAADTSGNGKVSAYDASLIAQFAVGKISRFPVADDQDPASEWAFRYDEDGDGTYEAERCYETAHDQTDEDYESVLFGEVSGNWSAEKARSLGTDMNDGIASDCGDLRVWLQPAKRVENGKDTVELVIDGVTRRRHLSVDLLYPLESLAPLSAWQRSGDGGTVESLSWTDRGAGVLRLDLVVGREEEKGPGVVDLSFLQIGSSLGDSPAVLGGISCTRLEGRNDDKRNRPSSVYAYSLGIGEGNTSLDMTLQWEEDAPYGMPTVSVLGGELSVASRYDETSGVMYIAAYGVEAISSDTILLVTTRGGPGKVTSLLIDEKRIDPSLLVRQEVSPSIKKKQRSGLAESPRLR